MNPPDPTDLSKSPLLRKLAKIFKLVFLIPELMMGVIFAGVPGYLFQKYWLPAYERYALGRFTEKESSTVLFGSLAFGSIFFLIGVFILFSASKNLMELIFDQPKVPEPGEVPPSEAIAQARGRVFNRPKFGRQLKTVLSSVSTSKPPKDLIRPILSADGFYEIKSHAYHAVAGGVLLGFALFWNFVLFAGAFDFKHAGILSIVFGLFMLPFVVVGLGLLGLAIYFLSSLIHPNLVVGLKTNKDARSLSGRWAFERKPSRLRTLHISISVSEKIFQGTGDDRTTKSTPVFEQVIIERADLRLSEKGDFAYRWPENIELPNATDERAVVWIVNFHASSNGTPDLRMWVPVIVE